jgi:hypothetical protein
VRILPLSVFLLGGMSGCTGSAAQDAACAASGPGYRLPNTLKESSGLAWSPDQGGVLWSHNDSGHPAEIYAVDTEGVLLATVPLTGARNRDWEDMATGRCEAGTCIYLADTGDNGEERRSVRLYRVSEPTVPRAGPGQTNAASAEDRSQSPVEAEDFHFQLPDGPRDIEAMFVLPGDEVYFVTKGRRHPVSVYRYPPPLRSESVMLEFVQNLTDRGLPLYRQITGADASPDGRTVVIRSYQSLAFYRVVDGKLVPLEGGGVSLGSVGEAQGEGVALGPDGTVALSSEAGLFGGTQSLHFLTCSDLITTSRR